MTAAETGPWKFDEADSRNTLTNDPMNVMTRNQQAVLDQLMAVAGDASIVEEALRTLNEEAGSPSEMRVVVRRILEIRKRRDEQARAAATH